MSEDLPRFTYHPQPVLTGAIEASKKICVCCKKRRGFIYVGAVAGEAELDEQLCPWCIADGTAASRFDVSFNEVYPLEKAGISKEITEQIHLRTPGYTCWQEEEWLAHCDDACEFHGDASVEEVAQASEETKAAWRAKYQLSEVDWDHITKGYEPVGDHGFYKFVCRHCGFVQLGWDCS